MVQAAGSASSFHSKAIQTQPPKARRDRKTGPFRHETLWVPSSSSATVPMPKMVRASLILTPKGTGHADSPSWGSPCWWHQAGPQPCCCGTTFPQQELGICKGLRPRALHHVCISSAVRLENHSERPIHPQTRTVPT